MYGEENELLVNILAIAMHILEALIVSTLIVFQLSHLFFTSALTNLHEMFPFVLYNRGYDWLCMLNISNPVIVSIIIFPVNKSWKPR